MNTKSIMFVVCGVIATVMLWAQAGPNMNQPNYMGNPTLPQGTTGSTGSVIGIFYFVSKKYFLYQSTKFFMPISIFVCGL